MTALARAHEHLTEAIAALEQAKREVPRYANEAITYMRAETKVLRRRLENMCKAVGAKNRPAS